MDHHIKINNFTDGDSVFNSIIKLCGSAENSDCKCIPQEFILITINAKTIEGKLSSNKFKVLVELSEGKNDLIIAFCCESKRISLHFTPRESRFSVVPLYVICKNHDGLFQAPRHEENSIESACKRITLCSKLLQCLTAEKLHENSFGRKTFSLDGNCKVFSSKLDCAVARKMSQEHLWESIGREIMASEIASPSKKYLAFLSCSEYNGHNYSKTMMNHQDLINITDGYVALGGGGLALFGTACLYTWPEEIEEVVQRFEDTRNVDRTHFLDDSCYRGTLGSCFSTTLGSVLHELYHTFDLGHTSNGIMGRGFDNIHKFFTLTDDDVVKEDISKNFQKKIEFNEEFEAEKLSERLKKETEKKGYKIISQSGEADDTTLTRNCAVILCYHKWFNDEHIQKIPPTLIFDISTNFVKSTSGIRVIEIRREADEMVIKYWTFEGKILKFSFQIPEEDFQGKTGCILFVQDSFGNILKQKIKLY